tara:strand:- start:188 stop:754 length:567 start_codon:yes stop_codon:yes gene_type:complete
MHYRIHPAFNESINEQLEHNQTIAHLAELDTLLLEFEHSEEFRDCSINYLQTPKIVLEDFIHETGLAPQFFDAEALEHGLLVVIPARIRDLVPADAHQIFREQICFWAFVRAQWQFDNSSECLTALDKNFLIKLNKIIDLDGLKAQGGQFDLGPEISFDTSYASEKKQWQPVVFPEHDVFSLPSLTEP